MKLTVLYLSKKFLLECTEDSFEFLSELVAKEVGVPTQFQKLIFKGKSLHSGRLSEQGLKSNDKIMLIGSKANDRVDADAMTAIEAVEKSAVYIEQRLDQLREEFNDYSQGFVPPDLRSVFLRALVKRTKSITADLESCRDSLAAMSGASAKEFCKLTGDRYRILSDALTALLSSAETLLNDMLDDQEKTDQVDCDMTSD